MAQKNTKQWWIDELNAILADSPYEAIDNPTVTENNVVVVTKGTQKPHLIGIKPIKNGYAMWARRLCVEALPAELVPNREASEKHPKTGKIMMHFLHINDCNFALNVAKALAGKTDFISAYWPSLAEYNPGMTVEMWIEALKNPSVTTREAFDMLKGMLDLGGESTCAHLAEVYGKTFAYYNSTGIQFAQRVKHEYNCPDCIDKSATTETQTRVFVIPFVGRRIKEDGKERYSWKLRDELKEALQKMTVTNKEYTLTISANSVTSTHPDFTMSNLTLGDNFKALDAWFEDAAGNKTKRIREKNERKISNQTLPRLACQLYEAQLAALSPQEKADFIVCQYKPNEKIYKGIYTSIEDFRKSINTIEYLAYTCKDGSQFIIYAWNIFSTILFVKECLKKFGNAGDKFVVTFRNKREGEKDDDADDKVTVHNLNTILYGPPGTGKTYHTAIYAVAIIENKPIADVASETYDSVFERYNRYKAQGRIAFTTFHQSYGYEEFIEGIKPIVTATDRDSHGTVQYAVTSGSFKQFCEKATAENSNGNYVFIIDEINRGNISKIFGELITLIEPSKRVGAAEETTAILPYSGKPFGVPQNVYLIGTMNTADRSIATIDTALRRRFYFKEMLPNPDVLKDVFVEGISIRDMLDIINKRIAVLYDREHTIGHAYFTPLKASDTIETLAKIFENNIIPLLQEYFYEDYKKIRLVLGDYRKSEEAQFIIAKPNDYTDLFGSVDIGLDDGYTYEINKAAFYNIEAYRKI